MTDQTAGLAGLRPQTGIFGSVRRMLVARRLGPGGVGRIVLALAFITLTYFSRSEGEPPNVLFVTATTYCLAALIAVATRRIFFAAVVTACLIIILTAVARAKLQTVGMILHAYDFIFYFSSWSTLAYLWEGARLYVVALVVALLLAGLIAWLAFCLDGSRVPRLRAAAAALVFAALASTGALTKGERPHTLFYWQGLFVSSFFSSWSETLETLWRGQVLEAADNSTGAPFHAPATCRPTKKPPHIVLIHEESLVQPSLFPALSYDRSLDPFFRSWDGETRRLRVETYGGASWLTEFSILAGLSTQSFGGMRHFVQSLLAGKVHESVPEVLLRCGYRNVLFYPMLRNFVSNARFYDAIGLREIFDLARQGAPTAHERDRFYFTNALDEMERHVRNSDKPLFTYIQTMSAHWPYDEPFHPEINVSGGGPGTHPEMHEYLRRVAIAKLDYEYLRSELQRRFPDEPILIVHYGDHQPMATRMLLGFSESSEAEDIQLGMESIGLITYYAVDTLNYDAPPLPRVQTLDAAYLGAVMLEQAGLPLPEAWRERLRLMSLCDGRYYDCARRQEVLAFHRRLIDSGLVKAR